MYTHTPNEHTCPIYLCRKHNNLNRLNNFLLYHGKFWQKQFSATVFLLSLFFLFSIFLSVYYLLTTNILKVPQTKNYYN